jgi:flagellar hook capping protein FlgD
LVLTLGEGGARESMAVDWPRECLGTSGSGRARGLEWSRQPWPNPFNPVLKASVNLAMDGPLEVDVYDLAGRLVKTLARGHHLAGVHTLSWNGDTADGPAAAGVYLLSVRSIDSRLSRKILLVK